MAHEDCDGDLFPQVELNTIASSFGCLSTLVGKLHHYILERSASPDEVPFNNQGQLIHPFIERRLEDLWCHLLGICILS